MGKTKPKPTSAKSTTKKAPKSNSPAPAVSPPLTDAQVGPIPGLLSEADIEQQLSGLSATDKKIFAEIREFLARRYGSYPAARVWLTTPGRGFESTPLDAIRAGNADLVLEVLTNQSGPNPPYA